MEIKTNENVEQEVVSVEISEKEKAIMTARAHIAYTDPDVNVFTDSVMELVKASYNINETDSDEIKNFVNKVDALPRINIAKRYRKVVEEYNLITRSLEILDIAEKTDKEVVVATNALADEVNNGANVGIPENVIDAANKTKNTINVSSIVNSTAAALVAAQQAANNNEEIKGMTSTIDELEQEEFRKEANETLEVLRAIKESIVAMLERIRRTKGDGSVVSQVIEKLVANRDTLSASSDINAPMRIRQIDTVLNEVDEISFARIANKVPNQKTVDNLIKEMGKDIQRNKVKRLYDDVAFSTPIINAFTTFFKQETEFANTYVVDGCQYNGKAIFGAANLLMYHVAKTCIALRKRQPYLALIFKLYILRVVEVYNTVPYKALYTERFVGGTPEGIGGEETEESKIRRDIYHKYVKELFEACYNFECTAEKSAIVKMVESWADVLKDPLMDNIAGDKSNPNKVSKPTEIPEYGRGYVGKPIIVPANNGGEVDET